MRSFVHRSQQALLVATVVFASPVAAHQSILGPRTTGTVQTVSLAQQSALTSALAQHDFDADAVGAFYADRDHRPFWTGADGRWAAALFSTLTAAPQHGLPDRSDAMRALQAQMASGDPMQAEAALMQAYLEIVDDMSAGIIPPRSADREIHIPYEPTPVAAMLGRLSGIPPRDFFGFAPRTEEYAQLVEELARLRDRDSAAVSVAKVPAGRTMRLGHRSDRVIALRARLAHAMGKLNVPEETAAVPVVLAALEQGIVEPVPETLPQSRVVEAEGDARVYDATLMEEVRRYQTLVGLTPDGIAGPATLGRLNADDGDRIGQVIVNLERIRWLHRDPNERHIFVNQADFTMEFMDGGRVLLESRVIVGKRRFATPEFIDDMDHMVVNPTWHVPNSIATREILPQLQRDPTYLSRRGMRLVPTGGAPVPDGVTSDYTEFSSGYFPFRIKQEPSNFNALGRVKFMFPNQFAIYLHDTPTKRLFNYDQRAYSHGCVRVEQPFDLAYALLEGQEDDPKGYFDRLLNRGTERRINLDRPVRVYLTYRTVFVDRAGEVQIRDDVYGRDAKVLERLIAQGVRVAL